MIYTSDVLAAALIFGKLMCSLQAITKCQRQWSSLKKITNFDRCSCVFVPAEDNL
jgi:hypothetical protein